MSLDAGLDLMLMLYFIGATVSMFVLDRVVNKRK